MHLLVKRLSADLASKASSDNLPDGLHTRPALLPLNTARQINAQLSVVERARLQRALYREEFINRFTQLHIIPTVGIDMVGPYKAWCLSSTWSRREVYETLGAHWYCRHQHELVLENISSDFIHRLSTHLDHAPKPDPDETVPERVTADPNPYRGLLCVHTPNRRARNALHHHNERTTSLGLAHLQHLLVHDDQGRRRLTQAHHPPALSPPPGHVITPTFDDIIQQLLPWPGDTNEPLIPAPAAAAAADPTALPSAAVWHARPAVGNGMTQGLKHFACFQHLTALCFWDAERLAAVLLRIADAGANDVREWTYTRPPTVPRRGWGWFETGLDGLWGEFGCEGVVRAGG